MKRLLIFFTLIIALVFLAYTIYYSPLNRTVVIRNEIQGHLNKATALDNQVSDFLDSTYWRLSKLDSQYDFYLSLVDKAKSESDEAKRLMDLDKQDQIELKRRYEELSSKTYTYLSFQEKLTEIKTYIFSVNEAVSNKKKADELLNQAVYDINMEYFDTSKEEAVEASELYWQSQKSINSTVSYKPKDIENLNKAIGYYLKATDLIKVLAEKNKDVDFYNNQMLKLNSMTALGQQAETAKDYFLSANEKKPPYREIKPPDNWLNVVINRELSHLDLK